MHSIVESVFIDASPRWVEPTLRAYSLEENASIVTVAINEDPTPKKLDELLVKYPTYDLTAGNLFSYTVLAVAIKKKAIPLIQHILKLRPDLVNGYWHRKCISYIASATCDYAIFQEFISRNANIHAISSAVTQGTLLDSATMSDQPDKQVVMCLLRKRIVIHESRRRKILDPQNSWDEDTKARCANQIKVVRDAFERILGEDMFLHGLLESRLPAETRVLIWKMATGFWDVNINTHMIFTLDSPAIKENLQELEESETKALFQKLPNFV